VCVELFFGLALRSVLYVRFGKRRRNTRNWNSAFLCAFLFRRTYVPFFIRALLLEAPASAGDAAAFEKFLRKLLERNKGDLLI